MDDPRNVPVLDVGKKYEYPRAYPSPFLKAHIRLKNGQTILINLDSFEAEPEFYNFYSKQYGEYVVYEFRRDYSGGVVVVDLIKKTEIMIHNFGELTSARFLKNGVAIFEQLRTYRLTIFNYIIGKTYSATEFKEKDLRLIDNDDELEWNLGQIIGDDPIWSIEGHRLIITRETEDFQIEYDFEKEEETIIDILPINMVYPRHNTHPNKYSLRRILAFSHYWMGQLLDVNGVKRYSSGIEEKDTNMLNVIILLHNAGFIREDDAKYVRHPRFIKLYQTALHKLVQTLLILRIIPHRLIPPEKMSDTMESHYSRIISIKRIIDDGIPI